MSLKQLLEEAKTEMRKHANKHAACLRKYGEQDQRTQMAYIHRWIYTNKVKLLKQKISLQEGTKK